MTENEQFYDVCNFDSYVQHIMKKNESEPEAIDLLDILHDYVLDRIFDHVPNGMPSTAFREMTIDQIRQYNELVHEADESHPRRDTNLFSKFTKLCAFLTYSCPEVGIEVPIPGEKRDEIRLCRLSDIPITWEHEKERTWEEENGAYEIQQCNWIESSAYEEKTMPWHKFDYSRTHKFRPLTILRRHTDWEYVDYFISKDHSWTDLLSLLMNARTDVFIKSVNDSPSDFKNERIYVDMLLKYAEELMLKCQHAKEKEMTPSHMPSPFSE